MQPYYTYSGPIAARRTNRAKTAVEYIYIARQVNQNSKRLRTWHRDTWRSRMDIYASVYLELCWEFYREVYEGNPLSARDSRCNCARKVPYWAWVWTLGIKKFTPSVDDARRFEKQGFVDRSIAPPISTESCHHWRKTPLGRLPSDWCRSTIILGSEFDGTCTVMPIIISSENRFDMPLLHSAGCSSQLGSPRTLPYIVLMMTGDLESGRGNQEPLSHAWSEATVWPSKFQSIRVSLICNNVSWMPHNVSCFLRSWCTLVPDQEYCRFLWRAVLAWRRSKAVQIITRLMEASLTTSHVRSAGDWLTTIKTMK